MTNDTNNTRQDGTAEALERGLEALTRWEGGEAGAWRAAAASAGTLDAKVRGGIGSMADAGKNLSVWKRPISQSWLGIAAVIVLAGVVISAMLPALGKARSSARVASPVPQASLEGLATVPHMPDSAYARRAPGRADASEMGGNLSEQTIRNPDTLEHLPAEDRERAIRILQGKPDSAPSESKRAASEVERHVIRKATIELKTADVRATFAKAGLLVSEVEGEYLEASTLTGDGAGAMAQLTLRVSAARLSRVLNELRAMGIVTSENAGGEDVTDKVVDLEARIRNEQRVEGELLDLLKKQSDAKLKDVLELRGEINRVRERIEQLMGQREKLGRLTSLATVLVLIRADGAPVQVTKGSLAEFFAKVVGDSWQRGLETLIETLAFLVRLIVGGLVWWIVLVGAVLGVVVLRRRAAQRRASEPAPAI